jgi:hypothetical protein
MRGSTLIGQAFSRVISDPHGLAELLDGTMLSGRGVTVTELPRLAERVLTV